MSKLYLPTAEQMDDTIEQLDRIAGILSTKIDTSTWAGIQQAVRAGVAHQMFPIGTQFVVSHSEYGNMLYDVVAHDYYKSASDPTAHTMTLQCHNALPSIQADNREAFYYATKKLTAGIYSFTLPTDYSSWEAGTYYFTLGQDLPAYGQLFIDGYPSQPLTSLYVKGFTSPVSSEETGYLFRVPIALGNTSSNVTSLGILGVSLNNVNRCAYGSNNYAESAVRQFLNSENAAGTVWSKQTQYDRRPYWYESKNGFMYGLDKAFLEVVGDVIVPCSTNNSYESPNFNGTAGAAYTIVDKFYLASQKEITGVIDNAVDDGSMQFPYYDGSLSTDRIKYRNRVAVVWRTRTPSANGTSGTHCCSTDGTFISRGAVDEYGIAPVCNIV